MTEKEREAWEKRYAGDFLRFKKIPFIDLHSLSEFCTGRKVAGPDVKVTILTDSGPRRIGIELAWYSSDADRKKGSVAIQREKSRDRLREELESYLAAFPELDQFQIPVRFRRGEEKLRPEDCRLIAREIAELLGPKLRHVQRDYFFDAILDPSVFDAHPHLRKWIYTIYVYRNQGAYRGTGGWFNGGSGFEWAGIEPEQVCHRINDHDRSRYDLGDVDECWLVIYSTGHGGSVVRPQEMEQHALSSPHVAEAVGRSGFERVYFWCREFQWTALLGSVVNPTTRGLSLVG